MSYQWRPTASTHDMDGLESQDLLPEFGSQPEAKDRLGLYWSDLLEAEATEITPWDDGRQVQLSMFLSS